MGTGIMSLLHQTTPFRVAFVEMKFQQNNDCKVCGVLQKRFLRTGTLICPTFCSTNISQKVINSTSNHVCLGKGKVFPVLSLRTTP